MSIEIEELGPGYFKFNAIWDPERAIHIVLTLIGPDGGKTQRSITWKPAAGSRLRRRVAVRDVADKINAVQSWRAVSNENELSIGVADPEHYSGTVTLEIL